MIYETTFAVSVIQAFLVFTRLTAFIYAAPVFNMPQLSLKWKSFLMMCVTFIIIPVLPNAWNLNQFSNMNMFTIVGFIFSEVLLGLVVGLIVRTLMEILAMAGYLMDRDMGFAMTSMFVPGASEGQTVVSLLFVQTFLLLFLITNGHHDFIRLAVSTFETLAPGDFAITGNMKDNIVDMGSTVFIEGFRLSLPIFMTIMTINISMGLMTKFGEEFQVMMLSFPIRLGLGLFVVMSMFPVYIVIARDLIDRILQELQFLIAT